MRYANPGLFYLLYSLTFNYYIAICNVSDSNTIKVTNYSYFCMQ